MKLWEFWIFLGILGCQNHLHKSVNGWIFWGYMSTSHVCWLKAAKAVCQKIFRFLEKGQKNRIEFMESRVLYNNFTTQFFTFKPTEYEQYDCFLLFIPTYIFKHWQFVKEKQCVFFVLLWIHQFIQRSLILIPLVQH